MHVAVCGIKILWGFSKDMQTLEPIHRKICISLTCILCVIYDIYTCLPPWDVSAHGLSFWKTDWTSYRGPPLYHIYILTIISRSVSGLVTDFPLIFRVLGWNTRLLCGGPIFRFMFLHESWCVSLTQRRGIFYRSLVFAIVFIHCPKVTFIIPLILFHSEIAAVLLYRLSMSCHTVSAASVRVRIPKPGYEAKSSTRVVGSWKPYEYWGR